MSEAFRLDGTLRCRLAQGIQHVGVARQASRMVRKRGISLCPSATCRPVLPCPDSRVFSVVCQGVVVLVLAYVSESGDHANISTSSRYLKVAQHGLHVALKQYEETRARGTNVAHRAKTADLPDQQLSAKSFQ